ncbi:MAG: 23S rRNA (uracil(1939)-C(5))-methyltransferase RlmD [Andreesenia angusta]|nr:23S rRNA (uracil(1939)-C(5))-methyltransferase RlmD [Andreesenia angusta]
MIVKLNIVDMTDDGRGIGKTSDGLTVFLDSCLPGDTVKAKIIRRKKNYAEAELLEILSHSNDRIDNNCITPAECGGCDFMEYSYPAQLRLKEKKVKDLLSRISNLDIEIDDIKYSNMKYNYRNKSILHVKNKDIGYFSKNSHNPIDMVNCLINSRISVEIKKEISKLLNRYGIDNIDNILIRNSKNDEEIMVVFITKDKKLKNIDKIVDQLVSKFPNIKSIILNINKDRRRLLGKEDIVIYGRNYINDYIKDLKFKISPETFFQINPEVTEIMYDTVLKYADIKDNDIVYDIYSGIGTISLFLAQKAKKVYGIEVVKKSVDNAKENAKLNNIENVEFLMGKAEEILPKFTNEKADIIVIDPPRKGCERSVLDAIVKMAPRTVVYVSCNPATLARDLKIMTENNYSVERVQPLDMFSHTVHVENVVKLTRNNN